MSFNPLQERGIPLEKQLRNWSELNVKPYDKSDVDPYTRARIITLNGIETESVSFSHQFARHTPEMEIRKHLALTRRIEQQQQKAISWLIPGEESTLEVTIGYEQAAVDLTAYLARMEPDPYIRQVLELGLLEDFDHLYRYANLMDLLEGKKAERVTGRLTEITPGRPTVEQHRHPFDDLRRPMDIHEVTPLSVLHVLTITAAEQQTMNFYMTIGNRPLEPLARGLYLEIAQIEEQHVTQYESLLDPYLSWFQQEVLHHYNECYLYYSFLIQEPSTRLRQLFELHLNMELGHLSAAVELMRRFEDREPSFLPRFLPDPVRFEENQGYIRKVLASQIDLTTDGTEFVDRNELSADSGYHLYQAKVNQGDVPSEEVIDCHIHERGTDYRAETRGPNPVPRLIQEDMETLDRYEDRHRHGVATAAGSIDFEGEETEPFVPEEKPPSPRKIA